ncbi:hypothetical protein ACFFIX_11750 [Metabacillus herbersteinensis]|uniref:Uncharacterized protein n=1 Tax=Metabacillus herbersteinensis TaxID=283816 RepID=A0ABV6GEM9_9BACI
MEALKYLCLITAVVTQLTGILFLFINIHIAAILFIIYGIALIGLLIVFIKNRYDEKKEDDEHDYRDY